MNSGFGRPLVCATVALTSVLAFGTPVSADSTTLTNALARGATLTVRTIAGFVHVTRGTGVAVVRADAHADRGAIVMHVAQTRSAGAWTVCEVPLDRTTCDDSGGGVRENANGSTVDLSVTLPPGVELDVTTVSGDVAIHGVTSGVRARSVSGRIKIATTGPVRMGAVSGATTFDSVGGSIDVRTI